MKTKCVNYLTKPSLTNILIETRKYRALEEAKARYKPKLTVKRVTKNRGDTGNKELAVEADASTKNLNRNVGTHGTEANMDTTQLVNDGTITNLETPEAGGSKANLPAFTLVKRKRTQTPETTNEESIQKKAPKIAKYKAPALQLRNRYEPLAQSNTTEDLENTGNEGETSGEPEINTEQTNTKTKPVKENPPPPIILHGKPDVNEKLIEYLNQTVKKGFRIKHTAETTNIYISDFEEWKTFSDGLITTKTEYHTFNNRNQKTHAFVLRGLDHAPLPEELENELKNQHGIAVIKCYKMYKTKRPAYLVTTSSDVTLRNLIKVKAVQHTIISWERYYNNKTIIQCHRCQGWGHATSFCYAAPKCLKCAADHWTKECTKNRDTPAKCVNCEGPHTANSVDCPTYMEKIQWIEAKRQEHPRTQAGKQTQSTPNIYNNKAFPELSRYKTAPAPPDATSWNTSNQPQAQQRQVSNQSESELSGFNVLTGEFKTLNNLINVNAMLTAIRDLNKQLINCKTSVDKFTAFYNFTQNLDSYGI